jgi:ketosteroid isomerase-like protein
MNLEQVADELSIRRLVDTFCEGVNSRDTDLWASVWDDDDPTFSFGLNDIRGKDAIVSGFVRGIAHYKVLFQVFSNGLIDINGDSATGKWQLVEISQALNGASRQQLGRCDDNYIRSASGWRLQHRVVEHIYKGDAPLSGWIKPTAD